MTQEEILALLTPLAAYIASLPTTIPEYPTPVAVKDDTDFKALLTRVTQLQVPVRDNINAIKAINVSIQQIQELQEQDYLSQEDIRKQVDSILERLTVIEAKLSEDETPEPTDPPDEEEPPVEEPDPEEPTDPTDPVDPEEPEEPPVDPEEPPIENPDEPPLEEDPDLPPVEEPPVSYIGTAAKVNAFTDTNTWLKGTFRSKPGFSIPFSDVNKLAFAKDAKIELADGQVRRINYSQVVGDNMTLLVDGPQVDAAKVGNPYSIVVTDKEIKEEEPTPPVVVEPEPEQPPATSPTTVVGKHGYTGPLVGANFSGLGNNQWFNPTTKPAKLNTHYRTTAPVNGQPDYFGIYGAKMPEGGQFINRMSYAMERICVIQSGVPVLQEPYAKEIEQMMDAAWSKGGKSVLDMHCYCRAYQPVQYNADGSIKYPEIPVGSSTVNGVTAVTQWFPVGHSGSFWTYELWAKAYTLIAERFENHPGLLGYGLANEPFGDSVDAAWIANVQKLVNGVRLADKEHWIFIGGCSYSSAKLWRSRSNGLRNVVGDKIIFEAHQYPDKNGDGGGRWDKSIKHVINPTARVNDWVDFLNWCDEVGRPAFAGEYGCPVTYQMADGTTYNVEGAAEYLDKIHELFNQRATLRTQWLAGPGDSDSYANGMDRDNGTLKENAQATVRNIGLMAK